MESFLPEIIDFPKRIEGNPMFNFMITSFNYQFRRILINNKIPTELFKDFELEFCFDKESHYKEEEIIYLQHIDFMIQTLKTAILEYFIFSFIC